jgi:hypothetical protein
MRRVIRRRQQIDVPSRAQRCADVAPQSSALRSSPSTNAAAALAAHAMMRAMRGACAPGGAVRLCRASRRPGCGGATRRVARVGAAPSQPPHAARQALAQRSSRLHARIVDSDDADSGYELMVRAHAPTRTHHGSAMRASPRTRRSAARLLTRGAPC